MVKENKKPELDWPRDWQYRVITESCCAECFDKLAKLVATEKIMPENFRRIKVSDSGKYSVFEIIRHACDREDMQNFGKKIAEIDGVKIVL